MRAGCLGQSARLFTPGQVRLPFPIDNIFINHRQAHSGTVFDDGEIVEW